MSHSEYKVILRAKLPGITTDQEHLKWCRENIGEPSHVELLEEEDGAEEELLEEEDGAEEELYFSYRIDKKYKRVERERPYFDPCSDGVHYGVEMVLAYGHDRPPRGYGPEDLTMTLPELEGHLKAFREFLKKDAEIKFHSYGWYNGGDEPIKW